MNARLRRGLLGAAVGIAGVTLAARAFGFLRTAVFAHAVGPTCVGDTYTAANAVPNVVFEIVAGGALAAAVVPLLAGAVARNDAGTVSRTASALLTWSLTVLVPVALLVALVAPHVLRALLGPDPTCAGAVDVGSRMLLIFLPQIPLYGVAVVLTGVLQAHRRFLGPALGPLLSSVVVITAYLIYAAQGAATELGGLPAAQELTLAVGTTLGVAVLALGLLVPLRATQVRLVPTWRFPPGVAARARRLAGAGVAGLVAQQVALVVAIRLAAHGAPGDVVLFTLATAVFLLPWSVLAVPLATSAFPLLTAAADEGDERRFGAVTARSLRAVVVVTTAAAAALVAAAGPVSALLLRGAPGVSEAHELVGAIRAFAPGVVGYGLVALLGRALYARGSNRVAAMATVAGWISVAVADVVLVLSFPDVERVVLLGVGNAVGVTVGGLALLVAVLQVAGREALAGSERTALVATLGAAAGLFVALVLPLDVPEGSFALALVVAVVAVAVVGVVQAGLLRLLDPVGLRAVLRG